MSRVGIVDVGTYMPERWMPAAEIAKLSGIPEDVIVERFGLDGKHIAGPNDHVSTMGARAANQALSRAGLMPSEIDVVAYFGSMAKDYQVWSASPKIQDLIGASNAWTLEMATVSSGGPVAMAVASSMLKGDESLHNILLVGGSRESHLLDYQNERSRFMFNFGDGAAAVILGRGPGVHEILGYRIVSDGQFADDVLVPGGGTRHPASVQTVEAGMHFFDVPDPISMKERLDPISANNFVKVAKDVCADGGVDLSEVGLLAILHTKRSFFEWMIDQLGIPESRAAYLRRHGHMSGIDPLVGIDLHRDELQTGDLVLCLAAGTGYSWAATLLRW